MKKTYKTLFKDTVIKGIYHSWIKKEDAYFMRIDIEGDMKYKALPNNKKEAEQAFHYFNMLFCSYFDTDGRQSYLDVIDAYIDAHIVRRLNEEDINEIKAKSKYIEEGL